MNLKGNLFKHVPTQLKIETAQGCTRRCDFCGIHSTGNKIKLMNKEIMDLVVEYVDLNTLRIDFEMHGEPLLNENVHYLIDKLRLKNKYYQLTMLSNMDIPIKKHKSLNYVIELFKAGLNYLHIDLYDKETKLKLFDLFRFHLKELKEQGIKIYDFYSIPYNVWSYRRPPFREIIICDEIDSDSRHKKATRRFHNAGGNMKIEKQIQLFNSVYVNQKCAEPFRSLPITYSGDYLMCCVDFNKSVVLGNIQTTSINKVWNSDLLWNIRWILHNKRRDLIYTCRICNVKTFRSGLYYYLGTKYDLISSSKKINKLIKLNENQLLTEEYYNESF